MERPTPLLPLFGLSSQAACRRGVLRSAVATLSTQHRHGVICVAFLDAGNYRLPRSIVGSRWPGPPAACLFCSAPGKRLKDYPTVPERTTVSRSVANRPTAYGLCSRSRAPTFGGTGVSRGGRLLTAGPRHHLSSLHIRSLFVARTCCSRTGSAVYNALSG